jgi:ABC-type multidrug transport system ATPase subunit
LLSDRIVLLTTHATKYYADAAHIVQLEGGTIVAQGSFEALKTTLPLKGSILDESCARGSKIVGQREVWSHDGKDVEGVNLQEEEEDRKSGSVSLKLYLEYLLHGASPFILVLVPVLYFSGAG